MEITLEIVDKIAERSMLSFTADEKLEVQKSMQDMVDFFNQLNAIDTDAVEPLLHINDVPQVLRNDEAAITLHKKDALANAAVHDADYFKVPKIINK
jgi:aspartyl-tRNA(Asn)/glutamyl-tRNA(Gln) amidotransferase subunit C